MKKSQCKSDAELLSSLLNAPCTLFEGRSLADMLRAPLTFEGIGEKRAEKLYDLQEVTRRLMVREAESKITVIHGPEDVAHAIMPRFRYESKEHFSLVCLNTKNHIIAIEDVSIGSLQASIVHPREVFLTAIKYHSASIILCHNHPSGNTSPSREDIAVTHRLVKAGKIMDVPVLDHIIIGDNRWLSLKDNGMLN